MDAAIQVRQRLIAAIGDRYEVLQPIGAGGMATVFLTRHRRHGGFCAVKVLADHLAQQEPLVKSFLTEAQASASLHAHPNIVKVVDIGETGHLHYMIMNYVEGEDLSSYLNRKGKLPWKQAAYIALQVADALAYAHHRGVIHRDLKPSNIRLSMQGGVTVIDFGIAKVGQTPSSFTKMGARVGTPHYMSPEQIQGQPIDHRSDLYSLGIMLYQMALGRRPFDGENEQAIWYAHLTIEPAIPREIDPDIPEPLSYIILKLLAKQPEDRYESAAQLVRHLRRLDLGEAAETLEPIDQLHIDELRARPITQASPALPPELRDRRGRSTGRKLRAFAAVAMGIVLAAVAWAVFPSDPTPPPPSEFVVTQPAASAPAEADPVARPSEPRAASPAKAQADEPAYGRAARRTQVNGVTLEFVPIEPGQFKMGCSPGDGECDDDETPHTVPITRAFEMQTTEVTQQQWEAVMGAGSNPSLFKGADRPVETVSWDDVHRFLQRLNQMAGDGYRYRLPTEAEWEFAARAGTAGARYGELDEVAWYGDNSGEQTQPVKKMPPNAWGLYDMLGNVWEWCQDVYGGYPTSPVAVPHGTASSQYQTLRGGSWYSDSRSVRASNRIRYEPAIWSNDFGFRCVREAQ